MSDRRFEWDVIIVGAGPAGLSAALILARCCRRVLICDSGTPRSWAAREIHCFITHDGESQSHFREAARHDLARYENVSFKSARVTHGTANHDEGFSVVTAENESFLTRKILICTGLIDELPKIPQVNDFFGTSIFPCPYCDGWEFRNRTIAVYGAGVRGFEMARAMTAWSSQVLLCTDANRDLTKGQRLALQRNRIVVREEKLIRLKGVNGQLQSIDFENAETAQCDAIFFDMPSTPQSALATQLGCATDIDGAIRHGKHNATSVAGVYAAGNILKDVQLSIIAAAEGAQAAFGINRELTREDFATRGRDQHGDEFQVATISATESEITATHQL